MSKDLVQIRLPEIKLSENEKLEPEIYGCLGIPLFEEFDPNNFSSNSAKLQELITKHSFLQLLESLPSFKAELAQIKEFTVLDKQKKTLRVIFYGLGKEAELKSLNSLRKVFATVARQAQKASKLALVLPLLPQSKFSEVDLLRVACESSLLAPYRFKKYLTKLEESPAKLAELALFLPKITNQVRAEEQIEKTKVSCKGVLFARELVAEPPNILNPEYLEKVSEQIIKNRKSSELTLKVFDKKACEELKLGAFLAVSRGSTQEPRLLHFHYKPSKQESKKHIALVGKGVTFDSGGLSLKTPSKYMEKMKYDMAGAASVIGLFSIISELNLPIELTGVIAACENMPDGNSFRTGDVITSRSGKTIEILNTDAEGRVTLADSVYYACEQKPDQIIDLATLTGAVVVALGEVCAGAMTNNQDFLKTLEQSFSKAGERIWELPMFPEYEEYIKSEIADMINTGSRGQAGPQNGAVFIKQFIDPDMPWVHLDIAGACWPEREATFFTEKNNPSGFGVLGLIEYLSSFS